MSREQLANGPKPAAQIETAADAAAIPERSLIAAADELGVRTQRRMVVFRDVRGQDTEKLILSYDERNIAIYQPL